MSATPMRNRLWAVGGGKGGVGKSLVSLLVADGLARRGVDVVLVDADLGGSNLHTLLGIRHPSVTIGDFIERRVARLDDVAQPTSTPRLRLIAGADDLVGIANPKFGQKTRLLTHLTRLDADVVLLDLGAGTSTTTLDFFNHAAGQVVVMTPQVTSIQNAYGFIKAALYRKLTRAFSRDTEALAIIEAAADPGNGNTIASVADLRTALGPDRAELATQCVSEMDLSIVVNMTRTPRDRQCGRIVCSVAQQYLDLTPQLAGVIDEDPELDGAVNRMAQFLAERGRSAARLGVYDLTTRIVQAARAPRTPTPDVPDTEDEEALA
jgi:flagellar biosynthesis protein FlhG